MVIINIIKNLITNSTEYGAMVLDCYAGTGTTGVACNELGRDFVGIEINPEYYNVMEARLRYENKAKTPPVK